VWRVNKSRPRTVLIKLTEKKHEGLVMKAERAAKNWKLIEPLFHVQLSKRIYIIVNIIAYSIEDVILF
jgi:hypothetical protein